MCGNCVNTAESVVSQAALAVALLKAPVHRALADAGLVRHPDPVAHDVHTVAFLRSLDLDPVAILGAHAVAAAERWQPAAAPQPLGKLGKRSRRPIGSHSLATAQ